MATANLGRVGFVNKGTYSGATAYKVNDVVTYNTGTYACIQANTGQAPTNTSYWQNWVADNAVHKTGDETIAGVKTFSSSPIIPNATTSTQAIAFGQAVNLTAAQTIAGVKTFSSSPIVPVPTAVNQAISMGNIIEKTGAGIGYGTGSGGTVTQLTSKSTPVTLNKPCGQITMNSASLAAGASALFTLLNNTISANDTIKACIYWENGYYSAEFYSIKVSPRAGNVSIIVTNTTASARAEAVIINFAVIKGAIS